MRVVVADASCAVATGGGYEEGAAAGGSEWEVEEEVEEEGWRWEVEECLVEPRGAAPPPPPTTWSKAGLDNKSRVTLIPRHNTAREAACNKLCNANATGGIQRHINRG